MEVFGQELEDFLGNADRMRGAIISHTIQLERNMDLFICKYFCTTISKVTELMELLVSERVEFSKKAETFIQILKKECKDKKTFEQTYPNINTDFQDIAKARNDFAHKLSLTPIKEDLGKHQIVLKEFKNQRKDIPYTNDDIMKIIDRINKYSVMILNRNK